MFLNSFFYLYFYDCKRSCLTTKLTKIMKKLNVYLGFARGKCREALDFYSKALDGEVVSLQTFGEGPMPSDETTKDYVMHAVFRAGDIFFMASDGSNQYVHNAGNSVTLNIDLDDKDEQTKVFNALSAGGTVTMPLQDTFWGTRFGMLTDKYGINWMTNCEAKQEG